MEGWLAGPGGRDTRGRCGKQNLAPAGWTSSGGRCASGECRGQERAAHSESAEKVDGEKPTHARTEGWQLPEVVHLLIIMVRVVTVLKHTHMSKHPVVYLKYIQFPCVNYNAINQAKKIKQKNQ